MPRPRRVQTLRVPVLDWSAGPGSPTKVVSLPRVPGLAATREALDGRTLVEFGKFEGRLVAVVVEPRQTRLVDVGAEQDIATELRPLLFALRRLANPRGGAAADAARASADLRIGRLRDLLIGPLGVGDRDELVVVPVGMLHGVPWSCLHDGPLAQAPSATFWVRTRRAALGRAGSGPTVLVAGPDLTGASEEVDALRAVHPGALVLAGGDAQAQPVVAALADADLAHLACHGSPRADNPMFSSLLLADGPVTVQELHGAGVAPHRLVLASCHSGADVAYAGDEVLGFVSAMLAQGTAGVVASIAAVPDVAAVDLMLELHRGLRDGLTLARALHAARGRVDRSTPEGFVNWCTSVPTAPPGRIWWSAVPYSGNPRPPVVDRVCASVPGPVARSPAAAEASAGESSPDGPAHAECLPSPAPARGSCRFWGVTTGGTTIGRSAMARPDKAAAVAELTDQFRELQRGRADRVPRAHRGAAQDSCARRSASNATYAVVKNTLTTIAAKEAGRRRRSTTLLAGPSAIAFVTGDPVEAAKGLRDFAKANPALVIKGGVLDGKRRCPLRRSPSSRTSSPARCCWPRLAGAMKASLSPGRRTCSPRPPRRPPAPSTRSAPSRPSGRTPSTSARR